jgi:DNA-binding GntR family transcriptional regulator
MDPIFSKAKSTTLRTGILEMLREAIMTGKLEPGAHLKENELAQQMSVSRSPVREALRQLEQEDLVVAVPNQGCFVKKYDSNEIEDIFRVRAALENLAFELIIEGDRLTEGDWDEIDNYLTEQVKAIEAHAFDDLTKWDMDFHEFFCRKSGSRHLLKNWRSLRAQIQVLFYQRFTILEEVPQTVHIDHMRILEKLRTKDIVELKKLNREINDRVAGDCIQVFQTNNKLD